MNWTNHFQIFFCSEISLKVYRGLLVLLMISFTWMMATQLLKATYDFPLFNNSSMGDHQVALNYSAPFLTCWFCTMWTTLFFPLYVLFSSVAGILQQKIRIKNIVRQSSYFFNEFFLVTWSLVCPRNLN